ncbi:MAG: hypothetical protein LBF24_01735 [Puniceicoccales bacterium]|nr:hypothetical protein [Puniceicoccales bacterium]
MVKYDEALAKADGYSGAIGILASTLALGVELPSISALVPAICTWAAASDATSRAGLWSEVVGALAAVRQDAEKASEAAERRRSAEADAAVAMAKAAAERKAAEDRLAAMKAREATPGPSEAAAMAKAAALRKVAEDHLAEMKAREATPWGCLLL